MPTGARSVDAVNEFGPTPPQTTETDPSDSQIDRISDAFVADLCALSPMTASYLGLPGDHDRLDDLSPAGLEATAELITRTLTAAGAAELSSRREELARDVLVERLQSQADLLASGWEHAKLAVIASPVQMLIMLFDLMPTATDNDWSTIARRMQAVPDALAGYRASLDHAATAGQVVAARQIRKAAEQARAFAGSASAPGYFSRRATAAERSGDLDANLVAGATAAEAAYADLAGYLETVLLPRAPEKDPVGRERYALSSRDFLGATVDLEESYAWGWAEFLRLEAEQQQVAARITGGGTPADAAKHLDDDPRYQVQGLDGLQVWMQELSDRAVDDLGRTDFDIPGPIRTLECLIAPPGQGVGAYYTGPSADFSRPGRMWWSVERGREVFSTWRETTTVYHEGVPGHHLQIATATYASAELNDFQRLVAGTSGHAEGWALYAERLVRELGYLADDGDLLGMLEGQLFRAARVVVDIGMHLELEIPAGTGFYEGRRWTPDLGLEFVLTRTIADPAHARDEIDRYLGWPGQAPAYKLGERVWIDGRDAARAKHGSAFDAKAFHTAALRMGGMGLAPLADRLADL